MEKKDIKEMSVLELKAAAYDTMASIEYNQKVISAINQRIVELLRSEQKKE